VSDAAISKRVPSCRSFLYKNEIRSLLFRLLRRPFGPSRNDVNITLITLGFLVVSFLSLAINTNDERLSTNDRRESRAQSKDDCFSSDQRPKGVLSIVEGRLTTNLRPRAAGERAPSDGDGIEALVAKEVTELLRWWPAVTRDELLSMGFSSDDIDDLNRFYRECWGNRMERCVYFSGGHVFVGESDNLFTRLSEGYFGVRENSGPTPYKIGNMLSDAYWYGYFIRAISNNSDGYIAVYSAEWFNRERADGRARATFRLTSRHFHVKSLPVDEAVKIVVTAKSMRTILSICVSDRQDEEAKRLRYLVGKDKIIPSQETAEGDLKILSDMGIGNAVIDYKDKENDVLWILREAQWARLRSRLSEVVREAPQGLYAKVLLARTKAGSVAAKAVLNATVPAAISATDI